MKLKNEYKFNRVMKSGTLMYQQLKAIRVGEVVGINIRQKNIHSKKCYIFYFLECNSKYLDLYQLKLPKYL